MNALKKTANIFNIQRFSVEDGPGIRTTVFFKGCPLQCLWCSNPESRSAKPQVAHRDTLCNGCGNCVKMCIKGAISVYPNGNRWKIRIDRNKCDDCSKCVEVCLAGALRSLGQTMTVDDVINEIKRDIVFYLKSGGGITASGGEPLMQADFVAELFHKCRGLGIHTALDTCGYTDQSVLDELLNEVDLVLYDVKLIDRQLHIQYTGRDNDIILHNAQLIVTKGIPIIFRIPIIPGISDTERNLQEIAHFICELENNAQIDVLPYHRFGISKYESLDMDYNLVNLNPPSDEQLKAIKEIFKEHGLSCTIQ